MFWEFSMAFLLIVLQSPPRWGATRWGDLGITALFAEATSCQLDYEYLAKLTVTAGFYEKVERIMDVFYVLNATDGLSANRWFDNGTPLGAHSTVGATTDSGYLLRQYLLMGDQRAQTQWDRRQPPVRPTQTILFYATDMLHGSGYASHKFEHLSCFLSGLFVLGAPSHSASVTHPTSPKRPSSFIHPFKECPPP
ncbi:glycoside hydrolase family 47 protein [Laccaria bicolor S238N-H82]|uniref:Glycoside hydrolase family 47 protein n=1 Tax=Laccaria bicolor (strain S238N-H82 / ATCC MYA-4686) TaxID=486041 RepID=B0DIX2_LACBS|nr:glycoside hydrolase family 47 protein [Laccaria bicolor S238N-H82]EDR05418.1 glycoside hydrolase family 47 protein [Laccaria bicolor S238N-H82]|eukprot:XP_001883976.1 glycoside hydrolase family 47 protein [Laccaria bicolor S238N-H82]